MSEHYAEGINKHNEINSKYLNLVIAYFFFNPSKPEK